MQKFKLGSSAASKKLYERSESIVLWFLILIFLKFTKILTKKLPQELSESEVQ